MLISMYAKPHPKTNISRAYYRYLIRSIEHDPLVRHTTATIACMVAIILIMLGGLIWFAKSNPGNLIQTNAVVSNISSGKIDTIGNVSTFITFDFKTRDQEQKSVRQAADDGLEYHIGQSIKVGYHPKNPNYARNLHDNRPPPISQTLWSLPFVLMIWFIFIALFRYRKRQEIIWAAADAADVD